MRYTEYKRGKRKKRKWIYIVSIVSIFFIGLFVVFWGFQADSIKIEGNERYSDKEIKDRVVTGEIWNNTLLLYVKNKWFGQDLIPAVEKIDVKIISPREVTLVVYEKRVVGYVKYLDNYIYFDKDGIVMDSTSEDSEDVPEIKGLEFSQITLYEELPVSDKTVFKLILNLSKMLDKGELVPDEIYISDSIEITLYFHEIEVVLGSKDYLEEKINRLPKILPDLEGKSGILHMETYNGNSEPITFKEHD